MRVLIAVLGGSLVWGVFACSSSGDDNAGSGGTAGLGVAGVSGLGTGGVSGFGSGGSSGSVGLGGFSGGTGSAGAAGYARNAEVDCTSSDGYCLCMSTASPDPLDAPICSSVSENGFCCGDTGYPAAGTSCTCMHWLCEEDDFSCTCSSSVESGLSRCMDSWPLCCAMRVGHFNNCYCDMYSSACDTGYTEVANCEVAEMECDTGEERLDVCSEI